MAIVNVRDGEKIAESKGKIDAYPVGNLRFDLIAALL